MKMGTYTLTFTDFAPAMTQLRFWEKVGPLSESGCREWLGARYNVRGFRYGKFAFKNKKSWIAAHRASWVIHNGPIPAGLIVRHKCDNPPCVAIEHLELGTHMDNTVDKIKRGRAYFMTDEDRLKGRKVFRAKCSAIKECKWGHPRSVYGRRYRSSGLAFHCLECSRLAQQKYRAKRHG